jgi:transposase-like protein
LAGGVLLPEVRPGRWWASKRHLYVCAACGRQTSLIAGTIFEGHASAAADVVPRCLDGVEQQERCHAKELQRELGISYQAAWLLLQKLRLAMVRPGRDQDKLTGDIEVDESYLGGPTPGGKRGRGAEGKVIIAIAVERKGFGKNSERWKLGRTRIQVVPDVKAKTLLDFVEDTCEQGSTIYTDGLSAYQHLPSRGFKHNANAVSKGNDPAHVVLPAVHRVASLVKRWLLGTHHGGIGAQHVEAYLDEFIFRFNRRRSNARGLLFCRLMQNAVIIKKLDYETIVWSRRGQAGKLRGPRRKPVAKSKTPEAPSLRRRLHFREERTSPLRIQIS